MTHLWCRYYRFSSKQIRGHACCIRKSTLDSEKRGVL